LLRVRAAAQRAHHVKRGRRLHPQQFPVTARFDRPICWSTHSTLYIGCAPISQFLPPLLWRSPEVQSAWERFPAPITASFQSALCAEEVDRLEWSVAGITQPLHELQDKQMRRLGQLGFNGLLEQIERVERERNAFFGGATVRNPADEASFDLKIATLR